MHVGPKVLANGSEKISRGLGLVVTMVNEKKIPCEISKKWNLNYKNI
jgi:hypothetical protein